jgi:hypothetical protein
MRGYDKFNFPAFDAATERLNKQGLYVISPADLDRESEGWHYPPEGIEFKTADQIKFMQRDIEALSNCDAIYMLKGWEDSKGARVEKAYAEYLDLHVFYEEDDNG